MNPAPSNEGRGVRKRRCGVKTNPRKKKMANIKDKISGVKTSKKRAETASVPMFNISGKEVGRFELSKDIFTGEVNKSAIYQAVRMYNANQRQGNASTKTRGDVSGGGKKPWRQKGTGRARAGSTRSPLWRHGGVIFGPHPRDFHYDIPRKIRRLAFLSSINSKLNENKVIGLEAVSVSSPKTKNFKAILGSLKLKGKSLFVVDGVEENVKLASRNLEEISLKNYRDFSAMDVITCDNLVVSKAALEKLPERFKE